MKKVVFLCIENSCRSQIAEAFAIIYGKKRITAFSAGSKPSGTIHPKAIKLMDEVGYDLSSHKSTSISEIPDIQIDYVISMGCGDSCPSIRANKLIEWDIPDPKDLDDTHFRAVRDKIKKEVLSLIEA
tara:strand:- start:6191 stop:6574 length:384 start_codon:yes stop_codon:yes gene_type:complete